MSLKKLDVYIANKEKRSYMIQFFKNDINITQTTKKKKSFFDVILFFTG